LSLRCTYPHARTTDRLVDLPARDCVGRTTTLREKVTVPSRRGDRDRIAFVTPTGGQSSGEWHTARWDGDPGVHGRRGIDQAARRAGYGCLSQGVGELCATPLLFTKATRSTTRETLSSTVTRLRLSGASRGGTAAPRH